MISTVDHAELLILRNRLDTLKEAEKVKQPKEPYKPSLREIRVSDFHTKAAKKLNTCPHELEVILQHAILTDNVMVQKAFKDFVMKAKLSLDEDELPMGAMRTKLKDCATQNDQITSNYNQEVLNYNAQLVRIRQDVEAAEAAVKQQWHDILAHLRAKLAQHKEVARLRVWDRCAVEGIMFFYKEPKKEDDAPPRCPLGKYKGTVRCSDAGWQQLADLPIKQLPDVIQCIRSNYSGWKSDYLNKHVLSECEKNHIFKVVGNNLGHMLEEMRVYRDEDVDFPMRDLNSLLSRELCDKYVLWITAQRAAGVDGADGITDDEVRQHIGGYVNSIVFHWEMLAMKKMERQGSDPWGHTTYSTGGNRRLRVRMNTAASSNNGGLWAYDEHGKKHFVSDW
jgi:hypothetical protein